LLDGRRVDPTATSPARPAVVVGSSHCRHDLDQQWTVAAAKDKWFCRCKGQCRQQQRWRPPEEACRVLCKLGAPLDLKDRYGEPERGSEWEPIKILLEGDGNSNKMNMASNTSLRLTTQVGQAHVATGVPLDLGTRKTPKSSPFTHRFGRGITAQRTTKGSHKFPPSNPQEQGPENNPKKSPKEGSENNHQE
jgi:hypothetical protein